MMSPLAFIWNFIVLLILLWILVNLLAKKQKGEKVREWIGRAWTNTKLVIAYIKTIRAVKPSTPNI